MSQTLESAFKGINSYRQTFFENQPVTAYTCMSEEMTDCNIYGKVDPTRYFQN